MKRVEAVIEPYALDAFKQAAPQLGIDEFDVIQIHRSGGSTIGRRRLYRGCEYYVDLVPHLRLEFVLLDADVQAVLHRLVELVHPESISVFRLDQKVRTISSVRPHSKTSLSSDQEKRTPEAPTLGEVLQL